MEVIRSSETSGHIRTTLRYIPEDGNVDSSGSELGPVADSCEQSNEP
jgi:hypothetical protein